MSLQGDMGAIFSVVFRGKCWGWGMEACRLLCVSRGITGILSQTKTPGEEEGRPEGEAGDLASPSSLATLQRYPD